MAFKPPPREQHDIDLAFEPGFALDQIVEARAARGKPRFDVFVPVEKDVTTGADVPMRSIRDITNFASRARARIDPVRAQGIARFDRGMAG